MPYVTVDIDVDMHDFDTDDLIEELKRRQKSDEQGADASVDQIFEAFYLGHDERALSMTKSYIQQVTGRVLP